MTLVWKATGPIWFPDRVRGQLAYSEGDVIPDANVAAYGYDTAGLAVQVTAPTQVPGTAGQAHVTVDVFNTAVAGLQLASSPLVVTPEQYGALGDGITNDTAAIQAAIDAIASAGGGTVRFGVGSTHGKTYLVSSAPRTDRGGRAILATPKTGAGTILFDGFGSDVDQSGSKLLTAATGLAYSGTFGPPSVLGGPTVENNAGAFSLWNVNIRGLTVMVPTNPTICGIDLSSHVRCDLRDVLASSNNPGGATAPSNTWTFGIRFPKTLNFGTVVGDKVAGLGFYTSIVISSSHTDLKSVLTKWCICGIGLADDTTSDAHATRIGMLDSAWNKYHLAGWNVTTGPKSLTGPSTFRLHIGLFDIEDAPGGNWYTTTNHVLDANNVILGEARFNRVVSGVGPSSADLTNSGGTNLNQEVLGSTAAWQTYTPTISGTGWALGNGTISGQWTRRGKTVTVKGTIAFGSTSTFGATPLDISLPVNAGTNNQTSQIGFAEFFDTSAGVAYSGTVKPVSATVMRTRAQSASGGIIINPNTASTVPFTWATGDSVVFELTYEAA